MPHSGTRSKNTFHIYISLTILLHNNGEDRKNLKKRSVRLYHRIFPFGKENQKNLGVTAIGRLFCHWSGPCKIFSSTYIRPILKIIYLMVRLAWTNSKIFRTD